MLSLDDKLFCVLFSCKDTLASAKLPYYIYILQQTGVDFEFRFKLRPAGFTSSGLDSYIDSLVNSDKLEVSEGKISLTSLGDMNLSSILLTAKEYDYYDRCINALDALSVSELYFVCLVDMLISDVKYTKGHYGGFAKNRESIQSTLKSLSSDYSDKNFDSALKLLRLIKDEWRK